MMNLNKKNTQNLLKKATEKGFKPTKEKRGYNPISVLIACIVIAEWIREVHGIHIWYELDYRLNTPSYAWHADDLIDFQKYKPGFDSPSQAMYEGCQYILKLLP